MEKNEFTKKLAEVLGDINALHPFREGNGRTQRVFISQLAKNAGYQIAWDKVSQSEMIDASRHSMNIDNSQFISMFDKMVTPIDQDLKKTSSNRGVKS